MGFLTRNSELGSLKAAETATVSGGANPIHPFIRRKPVPYLQIRPVAVEAHPPLVGDLGNLRQVVIFELIQADVVGQPGSERKRLKVWESER